MNVEIRHLVRGKEPAEDLIEAAESSHAELIVIGLRRRTPVGKLILGSNAQRILLDATCPGSRGQGHQRGRLSVPNGRAAPEWRPGPRWRFIMVGARTRKTWRRTATDRLSRPAQRPEECSPRSGH